MVHSIVGFSGIEETSEDRNVLDRFCVTGVRSTNLRKQRSYKTLFEAL